MRRPPFAAPVLLALILLAPGCTWMQSRQAASAPTEAPALVDVGQMAPDLEGEDALGDHLRLGDYRGQVVALSFWASWCPPCRAALPHERELVKRMEGRPFTFLGINCDEKIETVRQVSLQQQLNWRNFCNGGARGPFTDRYGVHSWPTTLVLDANGVVRFRGHPGQGMDQAVEQLVCEVERGPKKD
jgi:thiol-disulfide isomerase/thioredoxin